MENCNSIRISVRNLVEFLLRSGDIDNTEAGAKDIDAMQIGARLHRKLQKSMGNNYNAEVSFSETVVVEKNNLQMEICVEGRADGIIVPQNTKASDKSYLMLADGTYEDRTLYIVDEIKCVQRELHYITEPILVHMAQAKCYAYFCCKQNKVDIIRVRLTYCNMETEELKHFTETYSFEELEKWYSSLINEYTKWAYYEVEWRAKREKSIKKLEFPFEYRDNQRDLLAGVYRTILRKKKLYIEAPTGVGKTISTVFPTIKAMGEGLVSKLFYLTAKTITRTAAESTFEILKGKELCLKVITITAKEKLCILEKTDCNPYNCERAKGHYDRVNDAVFDMIGSQNEISREVIIEYAAKHCVCPFEMQLDISLWVDAIICDYNYVFDPNVFLRRFFMADKQQDYVFLVDEAHNLVERARQMYSAVIVKEHLLSVKTRVKKYSPKLEKKLNRCNKLMLELKKEYAGCQVLERTRVGSLALELERIMSIMEEVMREQKEIEDKDKLLDFYFECRDFVNIYEQIEDDYTVYMDMDKDDNFFVMLQCMNPARLLKARLDKGRSTVMFSATLLPINYYKEQLAGEQDDYAVYVPSPFDTDKRLLMIGKDVSTRYTRRNDTEYERIAKYITEFVSCKRGNYLVFFPSYQYMNRVYDFIDEELRLYIEQQSSNMSEEGKESFLKAFVDKPNVTRVGFCVMGGAFSEGIDLKNNRLIGVVIVGTGLPMVCSERELFREYYEEINNKGFEYAYLYSGMNKVLQGAGRVIRTTEDIGCILLLDERFLSNQYIDLFPREWYPYEVVNLTQVSRVTKSFWNKWKDSANNGKE